MKKIIFLAVGFSVITTVFSFAGNPKPINLRKLAKNKGIEVYNRELTEIKEKSYSGIRLSKDYGEGIAWIKGVEFSNGIIEFDVRGEDVKQHSFVGIAFHGVNNET